MELGEAEEPSEEPAEKSTDISARQEPAEEEREADTSRLQNSEDAEAKKETAGLINEAKNAKTERKISQEESKAPRETPTEQASPLREGSEDNTLYEEMANGMGTAPSDNEMYEPMDYNNRQKNKKRNGEGVNDLDSISMDTADTKSVKSQHSVDSLGNPLAYVQMEPASPLKQSPDAYEAMEMGGGSSSSLEGKGENDYEHPEGWSDAPTTTTTAAAANATTTSQHSSMGFDMGFDPQEVMGDDPSAVGVACVTNEKGLYDTVHGPPRPAYINGGERPESTSSASTTPEDVGTGGEGGGGGGGGVAALGGHPPQSPDVCRRSHSSSSSSISSGHSENLSLPGRKGSKGSKGRTSHSGSSRSNSIDMERKGSCEVRL